MAATKTKTRRGSARNKPGHVELVIWNVPERARNEFKAACARNGVSMRDAIVSLIGDYAARVTPKRSHA